MTGQRSISELVRAARAGDDGAFEEIMILTERRVAGMAWKILGDPEEVKDALQETFLRFFRHIRRFDEKQDLSTWLTAIAINVCRDQLRRRKRRSIFQPLEDEYIAPAELSLAERDAVARALDDLGAKERQAVLLHAEGFATNEVAAILGNTVGTVRVQLHRARAKMREFLNRGKR
jgi:RNA polymerase sigma factor (sigma-70 family)